MHSNIQLRLTVKIPIAMLFALCVSVHGQAIRNSNGFGTNLTLYGTTNLILIGNPGVTNAYNLHIRSPYGGEGTFGGILIDNNADEDLRGIITLRAGATSQHRRYIFFEKYTLNSGWQIGANRDDDLIIYNGIGHVFIGGSDPNDDTIICAQGTGTIAMNVGGGVGGGSGGLTLFDGAVSGGIRQYSLDASGGTSWIGLPWQGKDENNSKFVKIYSSTNGVNGDSGYLHASDKLSFIVDSAMIMQITNDLVVIKSATAANRALLVNGQQTIGIAGAHSSDYGLTIRGGSFSGSDEYISFRSGGSDTEFGRINVNADGFMAITANGTLGIQTNTSSTFKVGIGNGAATGKLDVTGDIRASQMMIATNGVASFSSVAPVTIAATGWTNIWSTNNAIVHFDGTVIFFTNVLRGNTPWYTNTTAHSGAMTTTLQPGEAIRIAGTSVVGRAKPF